MVAVSYKPKMSRSHRHRQRRRVRIRTSRKLKLFLLAIGLAGLAVGIGLFVTYLFNGKTTMGILGGVYIFGALSLLCGHQAIKAAEADASRRRGGDEDQ